MPACYAWRHLASGVRQRDLQKWTATLVPLARFGSPAATTASRFWRAANGDSTRRRVPAKSAAGPPFQLPHWRLVQFEIGGNLMVSST
jgi:hypothetical protein